MLVLFQVLRLKICLVKPLAKSLSSQALMNIIEGMMSYDYNVDLTYQLIYVIRVKLKKHIVIKEIKEDVTLICMENWIKKHR